MTGTDRMLAWLRDAMDAAQREAEAATPGPWAPGTGDPGDDEVYTEHDGEHGDLFGEVVAYVRGQEYRGKCGRTLANMHLIASHADPTAVLRRIAADRRALERHWPRETLAVVKAPNKVGRVTTCDHDCRPWPCPDITDLAEAWGWTEAATKADTDTAMSGDTVEIRMTDEEAEGFERVTSALVHFVRPLFEDEVRRRQRLLNDFFNRRPNAERPHSPGCYEASWGWVHVKPGCHCPR
ncbi:DUF6221 family protein [Streptomyces sp. NPDC056682]|uniref:DUF6221 family protein n=1 Tax=Streptomyces sp. NPDC056682 TaxID=3345909 RepID=UPI0036C313B7